VFAAALAAFAGSALAQASSQSGGAAAKEPSAAVAVPSTKQILKKYLDATGGRAAWEKIDSRVSQGTVEIPAMNLTGTAEMYEKAPDLALVKIVLSDSVFQEGFDGKVAWSSDPKNGVREQTGAQLEETRRESDFRFPADFRKLYPKVSAARAGTIGERPVYVIEATPRDGGKPDEAYFDADSGLLVRLVTQHHADDGTVEPFQQDFSDYRAVDGVKIPFVIHQSGKQVDFTIRVQKVSRNVPVDVRQFSKPVAQ